MSGMELVCVYPEEEEEEEETEEAVWKKIKKKGVEQGEEIRKKAYKIIILYNAKTINNARHVAHTINEEGEITRDKGQSGGETFFARFEDYREAVEVYVPGDDEMDKDNEENEAKETSTSGRNQNKANGKLCPGLVRAAAQMLPFEESLVLVSPHFGYGDAGRFSFPHVPPRASIAYEVTALNAEPMDVGGGMRHEMFFEGRLRAAKYHREAGNAFFADRKWREAWKCYQSGLSYFSDEVMLQLADAGQYLEDALNEKRPLHLNTAACCLEVRRRSKTASLSLCMYVCAI